MGRPTRMKAAGLTYHITSRTDGHRILLQAKHDRKALCKILGRVLSKYEVILYAFTCMGNHFHVLIHISNDADLSQIMCEFKTAYSKYFNRRYHRCGHFWGDRFRSTIVEDDKHALTCLRYIDRNPVHAGLVDHPRNWPYASYHAYAYGQVHPILHLVPHPSYLALAKDGRRRCTMYQQYVLGVDTASDDLIGRLPRRRIYGSETFTKLILQMSSGAVRTAGSSPAN